MSQINYTPISKPFVVSAVVLAFIGVSIGSVWMFALMGLQIPYISIFFQVHKTIQLEGFLTLLIMGISYMIIPRFRNVLIPSNKLALLSFLLVISSVVLEAYFRLYDQDLLIVSQTIRLAGIAVFSGLIFYTMKTAPKLLKESDYFVMISISMLIAVHIVPLFDTPPNSLNNIQLWLLFPVLTVFGVEYKTLPSFLGFIRPKRSFTILCLLATITSCALGIASLYYENQIISILFNGTFVLSITSFVISVYIYGGFDNREIVSLMPAEKRARYNSILLHTRIGFAFLIAGFLLGILFNLQNSFLFYDLSIHYIAIGFIGVTIMLFFPLMLPPITGKTINFLHFNKIPIVLVLSALLLRTIGDAVIVKSAQNPLGLVFGVSGFVVLAAMFSFVMMIHKSMETPSVNVQFKKK